VAKRGFHRRFKNYLALLPYLLEKRAEPMKVSDAKSKKKKKRVVRKLFKGPGPEQRESEGLDTAKPALSEEGSKPAASPESTSEPETESEPNIDKPKPTAPKKIERTDSSRVEHRKSKGLDTSKPALSEEGSKPAASPEYWRKTTKAR
jgi:hypothetical protein